MSLFDRMKKTLSIRPMYVFVDLSGARRIGEVVKLNRKTTWVKVRSGAQTFDYIQRHNSKHHVAPYKLGTRYTLEEEVNIETTDTPAGK